MTPDRIKQHLTPDLLKPRFRRKAEGQHPTFGHCYVAAEALYHLLGGREAGLKAVRGRDDQGIVHWWLEDAEGAILDPTAEQYTSKGLSPPYERGRAAGFLTREPSKRARVLMDRVFVEAPTETEDPQA